MNRITIIAEAGVNHNGKLKIAYRVVDVAKECGADFIKFQTSIPKLHVSKFAKKANYQFKNWKKKGSQLQMLQKLSLTYNDFKKIKKYCKKKKIEFLSTKTLRTRQHAENQLQTVRKHQVSTTGTLYRTVCVSGTSRAG